MPAWTCKSRDGSAQRVDAAALLAGTGKGNSLRVPLRNRAEGEAGGRRVFLCVALCECELD